jgi:hypothetical protein
LRLHDGQISALQRQKINWQVHSKDLLPMAFTKEEGGDEKVIYPFDLTVFADS